MRTSKTKLVLQSQVGFASLYHNYILRKARAVPGCNSSKAADGWPWGEKCGGIWPTWTRSLTFAQRQHGVRSHSFLDFLFNAVVMMFVCAMNESWLNVSCTPPLCLLHTMRHFDCIITCSNLVCEGNQPIYHNISKQFCALHIAFTFPMMSHSHRTSKRVQVSEGAIGLHQAASQMSPYVQWCRS